MFIDWKYKYKVQTKLKINWKEKHKYVYIWAVKWHTIKHLIQVAPNTKT